MFPESYVGKVITLSTVTIGLVNVTAVINTIGDCFEEVFHDFLVDRTKKIEDERADFRRKNVQLLPDLHSWAHMVLT